MTCRDLTEFLMSYLEGELPSEQSEEFERHVDVCPPCKTYLNTYKETVALGKSVCYDPDGPVPEDVPKQLLEAIMAARAKTK